MGTVQEWKEHNEVSWEANFETTNVQVWDFDGGFKASKLRKICTGGKKNPGWQGLSFSRPSQNLTLRSLKISNLLVSSSSIHFWHSYFTITFSMIDDSKRHGFPKVKGLLKYTLVRKTSLH